MSHSSTKVQRGIGDTSEKAPPSLDESNLKALGNALPKTGLAFRSQHQGNPAGGFGDSSSNANGTVMSLVEICRHTIVTNLERYPPESLGMFLDDEEWNLLIQYRHQKTKPKHGQGGLDGTGRIAPALSDKFLSSVEERNESFRESEIADQLIWKDCVNFTFRKGGLTRPRNLEYPWPNLVERIKKAGLFVLNYKASTENTSEHQKELETSLEVLEHSPMNLPLLIATGIGKTVKKAIKKHAKQELDTQRMESLIVSWKHLAEQEGVELNNHDDKAPPKKKQKTTSPKNASIVTTTDSNADVQEDWKMAEASQNWRQLFAALTKRESKRRSEQGQRMREIRGKLNHERPKVVKVRPAAKNASKHERILNYSKKTSPNTGIVGSMEQKGSHKLAQLKREAIIQSSRQNRGDAVNAHNQARVTALTSSGGSRSGGMFAMAVAGACGSRSGRRKKVLTSTAVMRGAISRTAPVRKPRKDGVVSASSPARFRK